MDATAPPTDLGSTPVAEPRGPRMLLVDVFLLTACTAVGLALGRWAFGHEWARQPSLDALTFLFGLVFPGLFGALVIGHPVLMLVHSATGRRHGAMLTFGEMVGLVPGVSLAALSLVLFLCWWVDTVVDAVHAQQVIAACSTVLFALSNATASLAATFYLLNCLAEWRACSWTDLLGACAALQPGLLLAALFVAALVA